MSTAAQGFDDARLEDPGLVDDPYLHWIASTGARIRRAGSITPSGGLDLGDRPRGIVVMGAESRLVRAVLEPVCPVPFVAWPGPKLPAWVGAMDLVLVLGETGEWELQCAAEAARRGSTVVVAGEDESPLVSLPGVRVTRLPLPEADSLAGAVAVLGLLSEMELGPRVRPDAVADAADFVAHMNSPLKEIGSNPGKDLALGLADRIPLVWGSSVLAQRASRRIAEGLRRATGLPALAAEAREIVPLLSSVQPTDLFSDPYETTHAVPPVLLVLDAQDAAGHEASQMLELAERAGIRVCEITSSDPDWEDSSVERYVRLLQQGRYAAAYLAVGCNRQTELW